MYHAHPISDPDPLRASCPFCQATDIRAIATNPHVIVYACKVCEMQFTVTKHDPVGEPTAARRA
jgi:hypothetical protein